MPISQPAWPSINYPAPAHSVITDVIGTPTMLMSEAGKLAWNAQLDLYGVPREETAGIEAGDRTTNPLRYPGQYYDEETGLCYNRWRYYDPETGRYISEDPIGLRGGLSVFGYVPDTLADVDPLGLACYKAALAPGGLEVGEEISEKQAIQRLRRGLDVFSDSKALAKSLAKRALQGVPMEHAPHDVGYFPHFHPSQHALDGHSFFA